MRVAMTYAWIIRKRCQTDLNRQRGNADLEIRSEEYNRYRDRARWRFDTWMRDTAPTASGYSI